MSELPSDKNLLEAIEAAEKELKKLENAKSRAKKSKCKRVYKAVDNAYNLLNHEEYTKEELELYRGHEIYTWRDSTLRKWLNNDFINEAFSEEEKKLIPKVTIINDDNPFSHIIINRKVTFLLSFYQTFFKEELSK